MNFNINCLKEKRFQKKINKNFKYLKVYSRYYITNNLIIIYHLLFQIEVSFCYEILLNFSWIMEPLLFHFFVNY